MALLTALTGCSSTDEQAGDSQERVSAYLAFALSKASAPATRQGGDVVQAPGAAFRGMGQTYLIPFASTGLVTPADNPKYYGAGSSTEAYDKTDSHFFLEQGCTFQSGISAFLFYGQAQPAAGATDATNGVLTPSIPANGTPADYSFSLKQMVPEVTIPGDAVAVATYLTNIANAQKTSGGSTVTWQNSTNSVLKTLFRNFTGQDLAGNASVMAGSSVSARRHAKALKDALEGIDFGTDAASAAIKDDILARIAETIALTGGGDYPASLGLPDGAAVLLWDGSAFVPQVETSTKAAINSINRYCYPAELYYYTNSQIKTSNLDDRSDYYTAAATWDDVLARYEYDAATVSPSTRAVAIINPVQYAVACLQVKLKQVAAVLKDSRGDDVSVKATAFPLTGIIVGGQHTVGFDFKPLDTPDRLVYDSQVKTDAKGDIYLSSLTNEAAATHTLLLQSEENDEEVMVILEFQNNSGTDFRGVNDGIVYQGTKFYLVGSVKRPATRTLDFHNRVFTQDYTTTLSMQVSSLAKAYNVLPDILASRLEVGIQLTPQWVQATTTTIIL